MPAGGVAPEDNEESEEKGKSAGPIETIGPFKILALGNRLGSPEVMRAAKMPQLQENVLAIRDAKTRVEQSRASYMRTQDYLAKTTLRSPIDGVVTAVNAKEGETAVMGTMNFAGTVILTVSDLSEIITEVQVDEADFPRLKMGQPVTVTHRDINK